MAFGQKQLNAYTHCIKVDLLTLKYNFCFIYRLDVYYLIAHTYDSATFSITKTVENKS